MEILLEQIIIYGLAGLLIAIVLLIYILKMMRESKAVDTKISQAKEDGTHEPTTLYPYIDLNRCIKSGACVDACPEHDIIGVRHGRATVINASMCIGHGACVKACPVEAISLWIGTEKRGVDLPNVNTDFQSNVNGIYIAGEIGGMGLIRNAIVQGFEAVANIAKTIDKSIQADYDLIVVGAGPAGISATLAARKAGLKCLTLEQNTLGGTVATFPRSKIVMTHPVDLPLHGRVRLYETSKSQLLQLWNSVLDKNQLSIRENSKVEHIAKNEGGFSVHTLDGEEFRTRTVLLAIGRGGTPRKLGIPGELSEKVAYRLLEPEEISHKKILIVGGGDSAIEAALSLCTQNQVTLSYRSESFSRIKKKNAQAIHEAMDQGKVTVLFNTQLKQIDTNKVSYQLDKTGAIFEIENDLVYIFAGGELPTKFLRNCGIEVTTTYGEQLLGPK